MQDVVAIQGRGNIPVERCYCRERYIVESYGVSRDKLRSWRKRGLIDTIRVKGNVYISIDSVEKANGKSKHNP